MCMFLVNDYIEDESMGKANAIKMLAASLGVILNLTILFNFTADIDPVISWGIMSLLLIICALFVLFMIKEPTEVVKKQEPVFR